MAADEDPKVLLCGAHGAGKTSILKVVFSQLAPHETKQYVDSTRVEVMSVARNPLVSFKVLDMCHSYIFDETTDAMLLSKTGVVVIVIDVRDDSYLEGLVLARKNIEVALKVNSKIYFDFLIHKVDNDQFLVDERGPEIQRDIHSKLSEELHDKTAQMSFHLTSIYDHTIFEAFSKIVQKLIPQLHILEQCLDLLITHSRMEKAYLFDIRSKIYVASRPQPVDIQFYELCSDMIDVVVNVSCIYGQQEELMRMHRYDSLLNSDEESCPKRSCVIHLNNGSLLYLREVDNCLALVCLIRVENLDRQHLLEHNIKVFLEALADIFRVSQESPSSITSP
uniref:Ras-related GTP-binding protein n=1 Tax=Alexandrium monilatum TaxID=311494 RepID=A0A7S4SA01_9DINO